MKDKQSKIKIWCIHLHKGLERRDQTLCGVVLWWIHFIHTGIYLRICGNITTLHSKWWKTMFEYQGMTLKIFFFCKITYFSHSSFFSLFPTPPFFLFVFFCMYICRAYPGTLEENSRSPEAWVIGSCEPSNLGSENWIQSSSTQDCHCSTSRLLETVQFSHKWNQPKQTSLADCCSNMHSFTTANTLKFCENRWFEMNLNKFTLGSEPMVTTLFNLILSVIISFP